MRNKNVPVTWEYDNGTIYGVELKIYRALHKKTGNIYNVIRDDVIDCTNSRDGTRVVLYTNGVQVFARDYFEFLDKFDVNI